MVGRSKTEIMPLKDHSYQFPLTPCIETRGGTQIQTHLTDSGSYRKRRVAVVDFRNRRAMPFLRLVMVDMLGKSSSTPGKKTTWN